MCLERVVGVDAGGLVVDGLGRVADIGHAMVDVAALIVGQVRRSVGQIDAADGVAVGVILPVNRRRRGRDVGLVERNRNDLMTADVADVADIDREVVARLPLNIQRVVEGIRQLVRAIVDAERDGLTVIVDGRKVGQIVAQVGGFGVRAELDSTPSRRGSPDCLARSACRRKWECSLIVVE